MKQAFALIIDDNMDNIEMYKVLLNIERYKTAEVHDGFEAMKWLVVNDAPDIILLDINMPRIDGRQVYEYLRKDSKFDNTKIAIVTANSYMAHQMEDTLFQGDCILQKPFPMTDLRKIIQLTNVAST